MKWMEKNIKRLNFFKEWKIKKEKERERRRMRERVKRRRRRERGKRRMEKPRPDTGLSPVACKGAVAVLQ